MLKPTPADLNSGSPTFSAPAVAAGTSITYAVTLLVVLLCRILREAGQGRPVAAGPHVRAGRGLLAGARAGDRDIRDARLGDDRDHGVAEARRPDDDGGDLVL